MKTLSSFLMFYAVLFGLGIGVSYTSPMMAGWKWLPNKKGLVSGAILMGFGAGGSFQHNCTNLVNPRKHNPVEGVFPREVYNNFPRMLRTLATLYLVGGLAGSMLVTEPKKDAKSTKVPPPPGVSVEEALQSPQFWLMWSMIVSSASAGPTWLLFTNNSLLLLQPSLETVSKPLLGASALYSTEWGVCSGGS